MSKSFDGCESLWIEVGLKKENVIVGVVYRHPHNNMNVFQESIMQTLHELTVNKKNIYVMGNFNIDLLKSSNNHFLDFANLTNCFRLRNLINKPTRVTKETHTFLDHIKTNDSKHRMNSGMCLWDTSDHYPIFCVVSLSKSFHRVVKVTFRDMQQFSIENFLSELQIALSNK